MDELRKHVGNKIRKFRKEKKMTQKTLGEKIGVKDNTISSYESGTNEASLDVLYKISKILEHPIDDFFPPTTDEEKIQQIIDDGDLDEKDLLLIEEIRKKALTLEGSEREKLMNNIKFAVDFFENQ